MELRSMSTINSVARKYRIVAGKLAGEYFLFWNREECRRYLEEIGSTAKIWTWNEDDPDNYEVGDYIEALDGYCTPLLKRRYFKNRATALTFPNGTFITYKRKKDDTVHFPRLYGQFTAGVRRYSGSTKPCRGFISSKGKLLFVSFLIGGIDPYEAYRMAFNPKSHYTANQLRGKIQELLMDEEIREYMTEALAPFKDKLEGQFNDDRLIEEIVEYFDNAKKGTKDHLAGIKFIMEALGKTPDANKPKGKELPPSYDVMPRKLQTPEKTLDKSE